MVMQNEATLTAAVDVYVPAPGSTLAATIDARSGIVGSPIREWFKNDGEDPEDAQDGLVVIDYEGDRYNAANIVTWADRVARAAGRHVEHYPTVARQVVHDPDAELVRVGVYLPAERLIVLADDASLVAAAKWLSLWDEGGPRSIDLRDELACT